MAMKSNWQLKDEYIDKKGDKWVFEHNKETVKNRVRRISAKTGKSETYRTWGAGVKKQLNNADAKHYMDTIRNLY